MIKKWVRFIFIVISLNASLAMGKIIKVGAYDFPPFALWQSGTPSGLVVDLIKKLNETQKDYVFQLIETSSNRRYEDLQNKTYDIIFFENILWGWEKLPVHASKVFLVGGEVFITKNARNKTQSYFDNLNNKSIRGILGYHYGFAHFSTDPQYLKKWNLELTNSHEGNIIAVLEGRSDLAIVTKAYLDIFLKKNPKARKDLLISFKRDQAYHHTVIVRNDASITVKEMNDLLSKIKTDLFFNKLLDLKNI